MKSRVVKAYKEETREVFNKRFGVVFNGEDNLKPIIIENLIDSSPTALQCSDMFADFIGGGGFEIDFSKVNLNENWELYTPNDLLFDISEPISRHQAAFIHVRYNSLFEKESFKVIPYSLCRVGKKDSEGYSGKVVVSPKGWGKYLKKNEVDVFDVYNPDPKIIQAQVDDAGGWENYKGQILFFKLNNKKTYPKSRIETAYTFADTENQIGYFYNSTVHRGFNDITTIRHKPFENRTKEDAFVKDAQKVTGVQNASSVWMIEDDWDTDSEKEGNVRFGQIKSDQKPDRYKHIETSASNYIRRVYKIPAQLLDFVQGKLGSSGGEDIKVWEAVYNRITAKTRHKVETLFSELFRNYKEPINSENNWTIKQYSLLEDGTVN
jgi:hypothetical protein